MRVSRNIFGLAALFTVSMPVLAGEPFPITGSAKLAAYAVCRSLAVVDMEPAGSNSPAERTGVLKTRDGSKLFDNLAIRCLEEAKARPDGCAFAGACIRTDGDGDKLFTTCQGPEGGDIALPGGTGKFKDLTGKETWSAADAPGNTSSLFAFTLAYDVIWAAKAN